VSRWRPSPGEERWLEVASRLGGAIPRDALAKQSGGWRSTGPLARAALFVLGFAAAVLLFGILGFSSETTALIAGLIAAGVAEWLTVRKRLHASGIEEGLCVAGLLLVGVWVSMRISETLGIPEYEPARIVLAVAAGLAGLRLLNPFVTTCAVIALIDWLNSTAVARAIDMSTGAGITELLCGCALAAFALALGARTYQRPSYDRMLDWLVATLPVVTYLPHATWSVFVDASVVSAMPSGRLLTTLVLVALGVAMLIVGLRRRRHAPFLGFMGCVACLAVELRLATSLATEIWLIICGFVALVAGMALDRYLRQPRNGVTSAKLSEREGPLDLLQTAGATVLAGRADPAGPAAGPAVTPGEGRFGGGGASGRY
jgi:hypothetical protein